MKKLRALAAGIAVRFIGAGAVCASYREWYIGGLRPTRRGMRREASKRYAYLLDDRITVNAAKRSFTWCQPRCFRHDRPELPGVMPGVTKRQGSGSFKGVRNVHSSSKSVLSDNPDPYGDHFQFPSRFLGDPRAAGRTFIDDIFIYMIRMSALFLILTSVFAVAAPAGVAGGSAGSETAA